MKEKSMMQLLAPFAVTVVFYIVWCIVLALLGARTEWGSTPFNVFDFNEGSDAVFWVINVILIIIAEIWITTSGEFD